MEKKCTAIVLAAGQGKRMGSQIPKQFLLLRGFPVLYYSLKCFQDCEWIQDIILVTNEESVEYVKEQIVDRYFLTKTRRIVTGGEERYDSVYAGLMECEGTDYVFVHDGARPLITREILERVFDGVKEYGACIAGMPSKDTIKISDEGGCVLSTPPRDRVWNVQTPQAFSYSVLKNAHDSIREKGMKGITDDAMIVEQETECWVKLVQGSYENLKITTPEDLKIAEAILSERDLQKI